MPDKPLVGFPFVCKQYHTSDTTVSVKPAEPPKVENWSAKNKTPQDLLAENARLRAENQKLLDEIEWLKERQRTLWDTMFPPAVPEKLRIAMNVP